LSPPKSCGTLPHTDLVCLMRLSPVVGAWCERVFMECLDFLPASISAKSRPPLDTVLLVEFRRYASSSKENHGLLVEVSQFRVTGARPRDHANSALCKALSGSAGRQLGLARNGWVRKKTCPAAGAERLHDVDCFLSQVADLHSAGRPRRNSSTARRVSVWGVEIKSPIA
jgi:hypothetical protein